MTRPGPDHVRIRNYNVGFGDCFLLTFSYPTGKVRNVLIDFGSTEQSRFAPPGLLPIAKQIASDCGGKLDVVVATHRHADHISGFDGKSGEVIASLSPDLVVQPWTEDPALEPDAEAPIGASPSGLRARAVVARLADMQAVAASIVAEAPKLAASQKIPKTVAAQIRFLGETNLKNAGAVTNLMRMKGQHVYASFGTRLPIGTLLPGIKVDVLGPPTLKQSKEIAEQASVDLNEFWHLAARRTIATPTRSKGRGIFRNARTVRNVPPEARWVIPKIEKLRAEEMLAIVRILDDALNNTSLILLFEIGESLLLFPGDAQIENWRYALKHAPDREAICKKLAKTRFYKVGHHGSLNATPKTLWDGFEHRGAQLTTPDRLLTMVSTLSGKHGAVSRGTEVPRRKLIDELSTLSDLRDTRRLRSKKRFWNDVDLTL